MALKLGKRSMNDQIISSCQTHDNENESINFVVHETFRLFGGFRKENQTLRRKEFGKILKKESQDNCSCQ
jgi:hypothetical protein